MSRRARCGRGAHFCGRDRPPSNFRGRRRHRSPTCNGAVAGGAGRDRVRRTGHGRRAAAGGGRPTGGSSRQARDSRCPGRRRSGVGACRGSWPAIRRPPSRRPERAGDVGRLDATYDAATARVVLGHACVLAGRREAATLEWESARAAFAAYGAPRRQADVEALLGRALPAAAASAAALARDPSGWRIGFAGREVVMVDLKGIRLLGRLLSSPGKEHHVLDLAGAGTVEPGMPARRRRGEGRLPAAGSPRSRTTHRRAGAATTTSPSRPRPAGSGVPDGGATAGGRTFHGRTRRAGGTVERARTSVTRTLRYAIGRITDELPELGEHLSRSVRPGALQLRARSAHPRHLAAEPPDRRRPRRAQAWRAHRAAADRRVPSPRAPCSSESGRHHGRPVRPLTWRASRPPRAARRGRRACGR